MEEQRAKNGHDFLKKNQKEGFALPEIRFLYEL